MLDGARYQIGKLILRTRPEVDAFGSEHGGDTTSQIFNGSKRIRSSNDLERRLAQD